MQSVASIRAPGSSRKGGLVTPDGKSSKSGTGSGCHLSFYRTPPECDIDLDSFETHSIARLQGASSFREGPCCTRSSPFRSLLTSHRIVAPFRIATLHRHLPCRATRLILGSRHLRARG